LLNGFDQIKTFNTNKIYICIILVIRSKMFELRINHVQPSRI